MKKLISVLAALALVGAVSAAPRKAPAKKAPAKPAPAVAAPTVPAAATAAVAAAGKKDSNMQIGLYGGYSFMLSNSGTGGTTNGGGIYGGGDFLFGQAFKFGVGVSYMQTNTTSGATAAMLPIVAKIRYYFIPSLFIGANGGYGLDMGTKVTGVTNTFIPVGGELGYALDFGGVGLDIGAQLTYNLTTTKVEVAGVSSSTSTNQMYVTPYLRVNFQF